MSGGLAEQAVHLAPVVARRSTSGPAGAGSWPCRRRAPRPGASTNRYTPGARGSVRGEPQLGDLRVGLHAGEGEQVVEAEHAERGRPLEQQVEEVGGGQRVVEGPVGGPVVEPEPAGERAEPAVRHLVAHAAGGPARTVSTSGWASRGQPSRSSAAFEEADVEADVVADEHRARANSTNAGSTASIRGAGTTMACGDAGEHRDLGRDGRARGSRACGTCRAPRRRAPSPRRSR